MDLAAFAEEVGSDGPVAPVGGRTQWDVGGAVDVSAREIAAPSGIVEFEPAEMVVRVRAGTTVAELDSALAARGQMVPLDPTDRERATIGGVLAVGHSGVRRLRFGPIRDTVLEATFVSAEGALVKGGGPVVKNVTGFDLPRLLVGSLGTIGILAEVVLRAQPLPVVSRWFRGSGDPFVARAQLFRPSSILWDGTSTWVLLEGHPADVEAELRALGGGGAAWSEVESAPQLPRARVSMRPRELRHVAAQAFVAEIGVGTVHVEQAPAREPDPSSRALHSRIKEAFDPTGRLNPGRTVLAA